MYLHDDKEIFKEIIEQVAAETGRTEIIIEKDYYVTMLLKNLANKLSNVVFKGGTSLSKGYKIINRFSEDIDITFDEHLGEARRKKLKNNILKGISDELNMPIINWNEIQSDRDYNAYYFTYESVCGIQDERVLSSVKLETALGSYAFPTENVMLGSYIRDFFVKKNHSDFISKFSLEEFEMKLQSIERTYIDKIFALCDYYLKNKSKRYSRHLYDIYKLTEKVNFDTNFEKLFKEIQEHRKGMSICPSAKEGVCVSVLIKEFCANDFYKEDYQAITDYFSEDYVDYNATIEQMKKIAEKIERFE